jgi:predicted dehydrogenase
MTSSPVRIGCLGAARIAPAALIKPARSGTGAVVAAVAARHRSRGEAFAARHSIPKVYGSYQELVEAPDLDAVYVPLPNGLHAEWTLAALAVGKHVLCEKPLAANTSEAQRVADAATRSGLVVMEAFHWRYHPLATRLLEIVASGDLGQIERIEAALIFPLFNPSDIRWQLDLAGGSLMDAGCYPVHIVRTLAGAEPAVTSAACKVRAPGVDRWIQADLSFGDGRSGRVTAALWSTSIVRAQARVTGRRATMSVLNPLAPHLFNLITIRGPGGTRIEKVRGKPTYEYQLEAFVAAIRDGRPVPTGPDDSVANMAVIDSIYRAAGLDPRRGTSEGKVATGYPSS